VLEVGCCGGMWVGVEIHCHVHESFEIPLAHLIANESIVLFLLLFTT